MLAETAQNTWGNAVHTSVTVARYISPLDGISLPTNAQKQGSVSFVGYWL